MLTFSASPNYSQQEPLELNKEIKNPQNGKAQATTVVDLFVESVEEAKTVSSELMDVINNKEKEKTKATFQYYFEPIELVSEFNFLEARNL